MIPEALLKFSDLESSTFGGEKTFMIFLENVLPLMEKQKYSESLICKLCERLSTSLNILEIKNTVHCLAEINMNEKAIRKVIENFSSFKTTLETPEVMNSFKSLVTKIKTCQQKDGKKVGRGKFCQK